ncbi:MAG: hypothetical protein IJR21_03500 [Synergistaceae bacterium]|nr:hypothetical protein [Synergistaceae bacterium]
MMCVVMNSDGKKTHKNLKIAKLVAELEYAKNESDAKTLKIIKLERELAELKHELRRIEKSARNVFLDWLFD